MTIGTLLTRTTTHSIGPLVVERSDTILSLTMETVSQFRSVKRTVSPFKEN